MKLSEKALDAILNTSLKLDLAKALGFTEEWITRLAKANKVNGPLTTVKSVGVIREVTQMVDQEILEDELVVAAG